MKNNSVEQNTYTEMCQALEKLAGEYKAIYQSSEYQNGIRLKTYMDLLKQLKIIDIIKRLLNRNGKLDVILNQKDNNVDWNNYFLDKKVAVYTAIFGHYDSLFEPLVAPNNIDYFAFTDFEIPTGSKWKRLDPLCFLPNKSLSCNEKNRFFKMLPHRFFDPYDYSVYVDGNVMIVSDVTALTYALEQFPIAMFTHKNRTCVYKEAKACIRKQKEKKHNLERHINYLKSNGVPEDLGLLEATVIIRNHHDQRCVDLMEMWWKEFMEFSKRDQISLIDCLWRSKIDISSVGILGNNLFKCNLFIIVKHRSWGQYEGHFI